MGKMDRALYEFESVLSFLGDFFMGNGRSSEAAWQDPEQAQKTDIHINAENLNLNAQAVNIQQPPPEQVNAQEQARYAERDAQEAAYWQMRADMEQRHGQEQQQERGR